MAHQFLAALCVLKAFVFKRLKVIGDRWTTRQEWFIGINLSYKNIPKAS